MYAQIITEIKWYKSSGMFALGKWMTKGVVSEIDQYKKQTREGLFSRLHEMDPMDFEGLISALLTAMGFEKWK